MKQISVGIIGFGMAGQVFHAPIIESVPAFVWTHVYTQNESNRSILATQYPYVQCLDQVEGLIQHPDIDLIVIATSNDVHAQLAKKALDAGKHVIVEKPFTITTEEADQLIRLAEVKNLLLTVHHNARWNNDFLTIKKILRDDTLGKLITFEARYDRYRPDGKPNAWREKALAGSGILYDLGAHLIDQALQLFGWPQSVFASLAIQRETAYATDDFHVILQYDVLKVILRGNMLTVESPFRYHISGTKGTFTKSGIDPQEEQLKHGVKPHLNAQWGVEPASQQGKLLIRDPEGNQSVQSIISEPGNYPAFYMGVAEAINHLKAPPVTAAQARDVIYLLELCEKSHQEQRVMKTQKATAY
jgi:scyllo-inositol 2-dehydrogenase (NADP+)